MKNKTLAGVLALFLGGIGAHKFYLEQPGQGLLYLVFVWTFIPAILGLIEALQYFSLSQQQFDLKYNKTLMPEQKEVIIKGNTGICPFCREEIKKDATKCKHCGSTLQSEQDNTASSTTEAKSNSAFLIVLLVGLIIVGAWYVLGSS